MLVHDSVRYWARRTPEAAFLQSVGGTVSWTQADAITDGIAGSLSAAGLAPGDRIAVLGRNDPEVALIVFGALKAGVVTVPLNPRLAPPEWAHIVRDAQARVVFARADLLAQLEPLRPELPDVKYWVSWPDAADDAADASPLRDWTDTPAARPGLDVPLDTPAFQIYTSGTTGQPKGAVLTHRGIQGSHLRTQLSGIRVERGEVAYVCLPIALAGGVSMILNTWMSGGTVRLAEFSAAQAIADLDDGVAATNVTPTMLQMMLDVDGASDRAYSGLHWVLYGGAPAPLGLIRRASEVLKCGLVGAYGMTEFFTNIALMPDDHERAMRGRDDLLASIGRPLLGIDAVVVDPLGTVLGPGEQGELCLRGQGALVAYWQDQDKTERALADGMYHTGDIARIDDEGYVYLLDRATDMIKTGGFGVYPREVERVVEQLPGVAQVAVIGVPSETWGEEIKAVIIRESGSTLTGREVIDACRRQIAGFKIPKTVDFVDDIPTNANGKVVKAKLRERYRSA